MWKLESDIAFCPNRFPARGVGRTTLEGTGSWIVAYQEEALNKFKKPLSPIQSRNSGNRWPKAIQEETNQNPKALTLSTDLLRNKYHFDNPTELCSVDIAGLGLDAVDTKELSSFTNVAYINAADNNLPLDTFKHFSGLRELELPINRIKALSVSRDDFKTLQVLDLSFNNIASDQLTALGMIYNLRVLNLTGNRLKSIPPNLCGLTKNSNGMEHKLFPKLQVLYLDDNHLSNPQLFASLASITSLQELCLNNNFISTIPNLKLTKGRPVSQSVNNNLTHNDEVLQSPATKGTADKIDEQSIPANLSQITENGQTEDTYQPPFQNLRLLSIANNKIEKEKDVLTVAAWPMLKHLDIHGNALVDKTSGEPPLLATFLKERCGINIQRHDAKQMKPHIQIPIDKSREVKSKVAKIPKQPVDALIKSFRRCQPLPDISPTDSDEYYSEEENEVEEDQGEDSKISDPVFLTQVDEEPLKEENNETQVKTDEVEISSESSDVQEVTTVAKKEEPVDPKYRGYELLLDIKPDDDFDEPIGIQNNVKALRMMLNHKSVFHHSDVSCKRPAYEAKPSKTWEKMQVSRKPTLPLSKKEQLDVGLNKIKNETNSVVTMKLEEAFNSTKIDRKEAEKLLNEVQIKYSGLESQKIKRKDVK